MRSDALDHYGHGTLVAGLVAGNGAKSTGRGYFRTFRGAAPNANIINLRVLDENGAGTDSSVIAAIDQAISLAGTYNIRVLNLSLGRPIYESYTLDPICQAVEKAWKAGIVVVVAAGNDGRDLNLNPEGYGTIDSPGNDPYVVTVGAMNTRFTPQINDDIIASYSSKGPAFIDDVVKPDIVAPGNVVTSLAFNDDPLAVNNPDFYTWYSFYQTGGSENPSQAYFPMSGTSMSAGVASGAIADLLQAVPALTPDKAKALLMVNANRSYFPATSSVTAEGVDYVANYDVFTIGAGYLNIAQTIQAALVNHGSLPAGTAMSPTASYNASTGEVTAIVEPGSLWTQSGPWSLPVSMETRRSCQGRIPPRFGASRPYGTTTILTASRSCGARPFFGARVRRKPKRYCGERQAPTPHRCHSNSDLTDDRRRLRYLSAGTQIPFWSSFSSRKCARTGPAWSTGRRWFRRRSHCPAMSRPRRGS